VNLTDEQWDLVAEHLPHPPVRDHGGRPRADYRDVLNGILWVMRTGSAWSALPQEYPSRQVCRRRYQEWARSGVLRRVLAVLQDDLEYRAGVRVEDLARRRPSARERAAWWWQTVLLLRSPDVARLRRPEPINAPRLTR
jgi:transposase